MANLLDEALKEIYKETMGRDPLAFMKDVIDWNAFPLLLKDIYHNDTGQGRAPNIPIVTMVQVLFLQSIYNKSDETTEREIHDRISFMNFLDYKERLPDVRTIWLFRERLSTTGMDRVSWNELQRQLDSKSIKIKNGTIQGATFITPILAMRSIWRQWNFLEEVLQNILRLQGSYFNGHQSHSSQQVICCHNCQRS